MNKDADLKASAAEFLQLIASGAVEPAFEKYVGENFRHHNPYFRGNARALIDALIENYQAFPRKTLEIKHCLLEGDLVAVHSRIKLEPETPETATVHILRFEAGRIVELWDVGQAMPENSPNKFGMF